MSSIEPLFSFRFGLVAKFVSLAAIIMLIASLIGNRLLIYYEGKQLYDQTRRESVVLAESMALSFLHTLIYEELGLVEESGLLDSFIEEIMTQSSLAIRSVAVFNATGRIIAHSDPGQFGQVGTEVANQYGSELFDTHTAFLGTMDKTIVEVATPLRIATRSWGMLVMEVSLEPVESELNAFTARLTYLTTATFGCSLLLAFIVAGTLARPVKRLALAMGRVGPDLRSELIVDRKDEIGLLQSSFLAMLSRLGAALKEQANTREAMMRAEKLASVGALASGVAHEINNPLGGIKNCLVYLQKNPDNRGRFLQYMHLMKDGLDRIEEVVRNLLDFSRRRELEMGPVELKAIIDHVVALLAFRLEKNNIDLQVELPPDLPTLTGDPHQLEQVLVNLVLNAVDSMNDGGQLFIHAQRQVDEIRVHIRDTGPGIAADYHQRIFDPFFTTKEVGKGTGLGLTVSLNIMREHGGNLTLNPPTEGGAEFVLTLPLKEVSQRWVGI